MRLSINCKFWGFDLSFANFLPSSVVIRSSNFLYNFSWIIMSWCCKFWLRGFSLFYLTLGYVISLFFLIGFYWNSIAAMSLIELSIWENSCLNSRKWPCKHDCSIRTFRSCVRKSSSSWNPSNSFLVLWWIRWSAFSLSRLTSSLTRNTRSCRYSYSLSCFDGSLLI